MRTWTIRQASPEDAQQIVPLLRALAQEEGEPRDPDAQRIAKALAGGRVALQALLAIAGDRPCAVALYYPGYDVLTAAHGTHLADLFVSSAFRRQGIARALIAQIAATQHAQGGQWLSLTVLDSNALGRAFYDALGAAEIPVRLRAFGPGALARLSPLLHK